MEKDNVKLANNGLPLLIDFNSNGIQLLANYESIYEDFDQVLEQLIGVIGKKHVYEAFRLPITPTEIEMKFLNDALHRHERVTHWFTKQTKNKA